jgi:hypothetical protein
MIIPSTKEIRRRLSERLFQSDIVQNNFRGEVFEEIVNSIIGAKHGGDWTHCSADWNAWDFRFKNYFLQVKQAAARQSWDSDDPVNANGRGIFHIRPNSGYYSSEKWNELKPQQRIAQIYLFGWHDDRTAKANHFDPKEWKFFVIPSRELALGKPTISVAELEGQRHALHTSIGSLGEALTRVLCNIPEDTSDWRQEFLSRLDGGPQVSKKENPTPPSPPATS